ncbi:NADP-dependent oxidoreductase [Reyranella soli]|nr:NADP-dependent oxidoreductase [Reyranella soli]
MADTNRQFVIAELPKGKLGPEHFRMIESGVPSPSDGQVLVRVRYFALDAAMRAWMLGPTYRAALTAGQMMAGTALAEVVHSKAAGLVVGDLVFGETGWQEYSVLSAQQLTKLPQADPVTYLLNVYGTAGLTAYFGLLEVGKVENGDTVIVSAAAGAVGSIVGQIAKIKGCRVVGIAGGKAKCDMLTVDLGFDAAVDYKAGPLFPAVQAASNGGVDVYFDNVGGDFFEAVLFNMKQGGRLVACGAVSAYDTDPSKAPQAVRGVPAWFTARRLTLRGFIVSDFYAGGARERAIAELRGWVESGQLKVREDIVDGFENLPAALIGLLAGNNIGKRLVRAA